MMMRLLPTGSLPWLLAHEMRLALRVRKGKRAWLAPLIILTMLLAFAFLTGVPLALEMRHDPPGLSVGTVFAVAMTIGFFFSLMLSQALTMTVMAFFERGDFDLLLSSPIAPSSVLFARAAAIALSPVLLYVGLVTPLALPMAVIVDIKYLGVYGVLVALSLAATAMGMLLALGMMTLVGPRRTKTIGQLLAVFIGAGLFLVSQIPNFAPDATAYFKQGWAWAKATGLFAPQSALSLPARAVLGEGLPLFGLLGGAALLFGVTAQALGPRFVAGVTIVEGGTRRRGRDLRPVRGFGGGLLRTMLTKEMRLLMRDPVLISQVLLRLVYFIPMGYVLLRRAGLGDEMRMLIAGSVGAIVFFVGQIASSLAWLAISGEEAADLVKTAPVDAARIRETKLAVTVWPVVALAALPVGYLAWHHPWAGLVAGLGVYVSALSAGYINLWYEKPQPRHAFRRRGQGSVVVSLGDILFGLSLMGAATLAVIPSIWALPVSMLPVSILGLLYLGRHKDA